MAPAPNRPLAAALWMSGSITGFSLLAVAGRQIGHQLDPFEIMGYRSAIGIVVILAAATLSGRLPSIRATHLPLHGLRNALHFSAQVLWLFALVRIPLAQLFALEFSYPILVALSAPFLLGERLRGTTMLAAAVGFAGVLIVARPFGAGGLSLGLLAALFCAVGFAGSAIVTKRLTRVTSLWSILFWLATIQAGLGFGLAGWDGHIAWPPAPALPWVLVIGIAGLGAHLCLTRALSLAPASVVTPMDFLRLPLIATVGALFYAEPLDPAVILGGAVILGANWINLRGDAPDPMRARN